MMMKFLLIFLPSAKYWWCPRANWSHCRNPFRQLKPSRTSSTISGCRSRWAPPSLPSANSHNIIISYRLCTLKGLPPCRRRYWSFIKVYNQKRIRFVDLTTPMVAAILSLSASPPPHFLVQRQGCQRQGDVKQGWGTCPTSMEFK